MSVGPNGGGVKRLPTRPLTLSGELLFKLDGVKSLSNLLARESFTAGDREKRQAILALEKAADALTDGIQEVLR